MLNKNNNNAAKTALNMLSNILHEYYSYVRFALVSRLNKPNDVKANADFM